MKCLTNLSTISICGSNIFSIFLEHLEPLIISTTFKLMTLFLDYVAKDMIYDPKIHKYVCKHCPKKQYKNKRHLYDHLHYECNKLPMTCMVVGCGKEIMRRNSMKRHLQTMHQIKDSWEIYVAYIVPAENKLKLPQSGNIQYISDASLWIPPSESCSNSIKSLFSE